MNNKPVVRSQSDERQPEFSDLTTISCTAAEDRTRQELAPDTDINILMRRFGVTGQPIPTRRVDYGEVDFTIDLQTALSAAAAAGDMYRQLPSGLRERFGNWQQVLNAIASGKLTLNLSRDEPPPSAPVSE